jgi:hypothetical protein
VRIAASSSLRVHSYYFRRNQELVADAIMPTLRALFDAPVTSPLAEVKVTNVAELLVELTDVRHQMAAVPVKDSLVDKVSLPVVLRFGAFDISFVLLLAFSWTAGINAYFGHLNLFNCGILRMYRQFWKVLNGETEIDEFR